MSRSKRKSRRTLTPAENLTALKVAVKLTQEQLKTDQKQINESMRLMDKYKVPSNGEGGFGKSQELSLTQRTQILLRHLVALETELLNLKQENEELEEELDYLECELNSVTKEDDDEDDDGVVSRREARRDADE